MRGDELFHKYKYLSPDAPCISGSEQAGSGGWELAQVKETTAEENFKKTCLNTYFNQIIR